MSSFSFSRMLMVRQNFPDRRIPDVAGEVRRQLAASPFASQLRPGARVALGVGSRGINDIATIVRAAVYYWKYKGMHPFIIPAMGSHGAATAEGQADVLAHYGVDEHNMGCPVVSQLEVVSLLGHSSIAFVPTYAKMPDEFRRSAINRLEDFRQNNSAPRLVDAGLPKTFSNREQRMSSKRVN
jgi:hypothetical protein